MQLYAFDTEGELVNARQATKHKNYSCLECQQVVRLRGGPHRRCHFYHLEPSIFCRQHQKGPVHLQLQSYFLQQLPPGDCRLELPFPSISRIADVAWLSQKMIFEIQCSAISAEEVLARNRDYQQLGWHVIWILHDQRYNQTRLSAAEIALRSHPHFFSNMNQGGKGIVYDQFDICDKALRYGRLPPLPMNFNHLPHPLPSEKLSYPLILLTQRAKYWKYCFEGDLMHLFLHTPTLSYLQLAIEREKDFYPAPSPFTWRHILFKIWQKGIATPYQVCFRFLLERMCR